MFMNATLPNSPANVDLSQLWYVPNPKLRTKGAIEQARQIAEWIETRQGLETEPDEQALFIALHTAAYQASDKKRGKQPTKAQRTEWIKRWHSIREHLVQKNLGLVYSMISRFMTTHVDEDDLLSDAMFGLTRAVDRFDPGRGFRFSTYACNVIARALMRRGRQESNYRRLFPVQHDVTLERPEHAPDPHVELYIERLHRALDENLGALTDL